MAVIDGVFSLDARVIYKRKTLLARGSVHYGKKKRDAICRHAWVKWDYGHLWYSRHCSER